VAAGDASTSRVLTGSNRARPDMIPPGGSSDESSSGSVAAMLTMLMLLMSTEKSKCHVRVDAASRELLFWVPVAACLEQHQRVKEGVVDAHRPGAASPLPAAPQVRTRERERGQDKPN
jgi:hypothetical protein